MAADWQVPLALDVPLHRLTMKGPLVESATCGPFELRAEVREAELVLEVECARCGACGWHVWNAAAEPSADLFRTDSTAESTSRPELRGWGHALPEQIRECVETRRWSRQTVERAQLLLRLARDLTDEATDMITAATSRLQHPMMALEVYRSVRRDPTARPLQLARARPVLLAMWLNESLPPSPILNGAKVKHLSQQLAESRGLEPEVARTLPWWVRELPAKVDVRAVYRVARHRVPPSDAPPSARLRAEWFRALAYLTREHGEAPPTRASLGAARYVSMHWRALARWRDPVLDRFAAYVEATGHVPNRRTDVRRLVGQVAHWWYATREEAHWRADVEAREEAGTDALPEGPWPDLEVPDVSIRAARTARELLDESLEMEHCVYTHLPWVQRGVQAIYAVRVAAERSTVCVERETESTWAVAEHKAHRNRPPSRLARSEVVGWWKRSCRPENEHGRRPGS